MKNAAFFLTLLILASCGNGKIDTSKVKEEMKAREIQVVSEASIIERTLSLGDSLVKTLDVDQAMEQSGNVIKEWKESYGTLTATAYQLSLPNALQQKEGSVFAAYQYNAANEIATEHNVQKLLNDVLAYNAPILVDGKLAGMWSIHLPRKFVVLSIED